MSTPFSIVQHAKSIGTGVGVLGSGATAGNLIAALFAAVPDGSTFTYPTSVTDDAGSTYRLYSQSAGIAANTPPCAFLYLAVAKAGATTVTFNGFGVSPSSTFNSGPSVIVAEIAVPDLYQVWGIGLTISPNLFLESQRLNSQSAADSSLVFRAFANNGDLGGVDFSDTGLCALNVSPQGSNIARCSSNVVGFAITNQFNDVFLVVGNYNTGGPPTAPYFIATGGTLIDTTFEPTSGSGNNGASAGLAAGDFPYLSGEPDTTIPTGVCGLTLDGTTGDITGVPCAAGSFPVVFSVTDTEGDFAEVSVTFSISGGGCR